MPDKNITLRRNKFVSLTCQPGHDISVGGFTLIELLVVIAIISLLVSILLPSLNKAKDLAKTVVCQTNNKAMVTALQIYTNDYEGVLPPWGRNDYAWSRWWQTLLSSYVESGNDYGDKFLKCPESEELDWNSYGVNYCQVFGVEGNAYYPRSMSLSDVQMGTILVAETSSMNAFYNPGLWPFNNQLGDYGMQDSFGAYKYNFFYPRHDEKTINPCSFADGHVEGVYIVDFLENKGNMWGP